MRVAWKSLARDNARTTDRKAHRFDNYGSQDVRAFAVLTPAAIGPEFFPESAEVVNASAGGPPDRTKNVAVDVQGHAHGGMAQLFLCDLRVFALPQEQRGAAMP